MLDSLLIWDQITKLDSFFMMQHLDSASSNPVFGWVEEGRKGWVFYFIFSLKYYCLSDCQNTALFFLNTIENIRNNRKFAISNKMTHYSEKNNFKYEYRNSVTSDETTNYSGKNNFEYEYMVTIWTRKRPSTCRK